MEVCGARPRPCPVQRYGAVPTSTPGSSHSPQWNPASQMNCSWGAGSVERPRGPGGDRLRPLGPRSRPSAVADGQRLARAPTVGVRPVEVPRRDHDASPQPDEPFSIIDRTAEALGRAGPGTKLERQPSGRGRRPCPAATSRRSRHVVEEGGRRREHLVVAGPPGSLALRAVRGDVTDVAAELQTAVSWSRLIRSSLHSNHPCGAGRSGRRRP